MDLSLGCADIFSLYLLKHKNTLSVDLSQRNHLPHHHTVVVQLPFTKANNN